MILNFYTIIWIISFGYIFYEQLVKNKNGRRRTYENEMA